VRALIAAQLRERRRSLLTWGATLGFYSGLIVGIYPSIEGVLQKVIHGYPEALRQAFGASELSTVEQYLHVEMLSLIVPLAVGYLAARSMASALSGAAESGRLDVLLSAPVSRRTLVGAGFLATGVELASVLAIAMLLAEVGSLLSGAGLSFGSTAAGYFNIWPLAMLAASLAILVTVWSLRTSIVTGVVASVLVGMYVIDLVGRLDKSLDAIRYVSVFRYYGKAIENGIDPLSFVGVTAVAVAIATAGAFLFERRDLAI